MTRFLMLCSLIVSSVALTCVSGVADLAAATLRPVQATLLQKDGKTKPVWVFSEKINKIELGRNAESRESESSINWDKVRSIAYSEMWKGVDYPRAVRAFGKQRHAKVAGYLESALAGKYEKLCIEAALLNGKNFVQQKKYDEAVAALETIISGYSEWRFLDRVQSRIGDIDILKKDFTAARARVTALKAMTAWGTSAQAKAALLESRILIAENKQAAALEVLGAMFATLNVADAAFEKSAMALSMMRLLAAEEKHAEILKIGTAAAWIPCENPQDSAQIHLLMAAAHVAAKDYEQAITECALAASIPRAGGSAAARRIARGCVKELKAAEKPDKALIKKYTTIIGKL